MEENWRFRWYKIFEYLLWLNLDEISYTFDDKLTTLQVRENELF